ncbi:MAG: hypothetical protein HYX72_11615 [Acidobacteria bacterium]|nr:hypothetical protein [Acidobacteriota bacterium]
MELFYNEVSTNRGFEMTNEEFERKIEFIVNQQAQFASDIQQLRDSHKQTDELLTRLVNVTFTGFSEVNAKIDALVDGQIRLTDGQIRLTDAQARTDEAVRNLSAKLDTLADSQIRTEANLRNLSDVVDRHIREGRNGGPKQ